MHVSIRIIEELATGGHGRKLHLPVIFSPVIISMFAERSCIVDGQFESSRGYVENERTSTDINS